MKIKILLCVLISFFSVKLVAQSSDEDALKDIIRQKNESIIKRDSTAWRSLFLRDEKWRKTWISAYGTYKVDGWNNFNALINQALWGNSSQPKYTQAKYSNYVSRIGNNMATVEYDQEFLAPGVDSVKPYYSHELETLMKVDNQWKIATSTTIDSLSFTSGDSAAIEDNINGIGYRLLNVKKIKDAIEVFKVNVKLFPHSWNVYDSLGEAYADDGDTEDAIKNYKMSVQINPKNDSGLKALEKLSKK